MTRVNLVEVEDLADQHLFAEWRELKMVPASLRRSLKTKSIQNILKGIPEKYTLNTGHVSFFFNKMVFLHNRYLKLTEELKNRNYNITEHDADEIFFSDVPAEFKQLEWSPTKDEIQVNINRIVLRLNERPDWYRYYGKVISPNYFEELYGLCISL